MGSGIEVFGLRVTELRLRVLSTTSMKNETHGHLLDFHMQVKQGIYPEARQRLRLAG